MRATNNVLDTVLIILIAFSYLNLLPTTQLVGAITLLYRQGTPCLEDEATC